MTTLSLDHLAEEFAPLPALGRIPTPLKEALVVKLLALQGDPECPLLAHAVDHGFDAESFRRFVSAFGGTTIRMPSRKSWERLWAEVQIWMAVQARIAEGVDRQESVRQAAARFKVPVRHVRTVNTKLTKVYAALHKAWKENS